MPFWNPPPPNTPHPGGILDFDFTLATLGALAFSVHPAIAEAVYWIPGRCDLLLGIGFLFSALSFLGYVRARRPAFLLGHLLGLGLALLSKEAGLAIPLAMVAYVLVVERRPAILRDAWLLVGWAAVLLGWYALWSSAGAVSTGEGPGRRLEAVFSNLPVLVVHLGKAVLAVRLSVLAYTRDSSTWPGLLFFSAACGP